MNEANMRVNITSKGDEQLLKNAQATEKSYRGVEESLKRAASTSTRTARPVSAAYKASEMEENVEYGRARGAMGTTGAASRDFANQAQGLGGLVRLYATFAANIFAATAAFSALSRAMDTTNMIKGLDQLGAASGRNLGYLSKQLVDVTDGAISLRDSMEAVAKTSAAGLSNKQIMELGNVAKSASQALGVAMPDAISRLSRGISKIEPELLDELGIFVRVDKAVSDYALSVGKAATSLTDFERRQAYAIAVLKEGQQKFSSIDIDANPYSKLLASLANAAQKILEVFNSVLGPIAKALADNTTLILTAIGLISAKLLGQAIPAIGQWRKELQESAKTAAKVASETIEAYGEGFVDRLQNKLKIPLLQTNYENLKKEADILGKTVASSIATAVNAGLISERSKIFKNFMSGAAQGPLTTGQLSGLSKNINKLMEQGNVEQAQILQKVIDSQREWTQTIKQTDKAYEALNATKSQMESEANTSIKKLSHEWQIYSIARQAASKAERLAIIANIEQISNQQGMLEGLKASWKGVISNETLQPWDKLRTVASGTFVALTSGIITLFRAIQPWLLAITAAIGLFELLNVSLSTNKKQADELTKSIEANVSAIDNLNRVLDELEKKDPLAKFSSASAQAALNAISSLADSIVDIWDKTIKSIDNMSGWDVFIDNISSIWGGDTQSKLNDALAKSMTTMFKSLSTTGVDKVAKEEFEKILGYAGTDLTKMKTAINDFISSGGNIGVLTEKVKEFGNQAKISSAKLSELQEAQKATARSLSEVINSFLPRDAISTYAQNLLSELQKVDAGLSDPSTKVATMLETFKNLQNFPIEMAANFEELGKAVEDTTIKYSNSLENVKEYDKLIDSIYNKEKKLYNQRLDSGTSFGRFQEGQETYSSTAPKVEFAPSQELQSLIEGKELELQISNQFKKELADNAVYLQEELNKSYIYGAALLANRVAVEWGKVGSAYISGIASIISDTKAGIYLQYEADMRLIDVQTAAIQTQINLIKSNSDLELMLRKNAIELELIRVQGKLADYALSGGETEETNKLQKRETELINSGKALDLQVDVRSKFAGNSDSFKIYNAEIDKVLAKFKESKKAEEDIDALAKERAALTQEYQKSQSISLAQAQMQQLTIQKEVLAKKLVVSLYGKDLEAQKESVNIELSKLDIQNQVLNNALNIESLTASNIAYMIEANNLLSEGLLIDQEIANTEFKLFKLKMAESEIDKRLAEAKTKNNAADIEMYEKAKGFIRDEEIMLNLTKNNNIEKIKEATYTKTLAAHIKAAQTYSRARLEDLQVSLNTESRQLNMTAALLNLEESLYAVYKNNNLVAERSGTIQEYYLNLKRAEKDTELKLFEERKRFSTEEENLAAKLLENTKEIHALDDKRARQGFISEADNARYTQLLDQATRLGVLQEQNRKTNEVNKTVIEKTKEVREQELEIIKEANLYAEKWKTIFEDIGRTTESLSVVFGKFGETLGSTLSAFAEYNKNVEDNARRKQQSEDALKEAKKANNLKKVLELEEALAKQEKKSSKEEFANTMKIISTSKKWFSEKTAAYKLLYTLEAMMHAASIANQAKEIAATVAGIPKKIAGGVSKLFDEGGWAGFAGAAAFLALMSSLGSSSGGSVSAPTKGFSAEDRQETQGTGMSWKDGEKVENGYGVFGDTEAKADAIRQSIETIEATSVKGLPIYNQMLRALQSIEKSIGDAAKSLYSVPGLRVGSAFGTQEGTSGGGNWLTGKKSTSTEIIDSGIKLAGTLQQLATQSSEAIFQLYETVRTTTSKSGFLGFGGKTSTSQDTEYSDLEAATNGSQAKKFLASIFGGVIDVLETAGNKLGTPLDKISNIISSFPVEIEASLRSLTGNETVDELNALVSTAMDKVFVEAFGEEFLDRFREFGETYSQTLIRILDETDKAVQALSNIGLDIKSGLTESTRPNSRQVPVTSTEIVGGEWVDLTQELAAQFVSTFGENWRREILNTTYYPGGESSGMVEAVFKPIYGAVTKLETVFETVPYTVEEQTLVLTNSLIEMAGGIENFVDGATFFFENFFTESEQLAVVQKQVDDESTRLINTYGDTFSQLTEEAFTSKDAFKELVKSLDLSSSGTHELYTSLIALAPAMNELFVETEENLSSLEARLAELQGDKDTAIQITRDAARAEMSPAELELQEQIWGLEDAAEARKLETDVLTAQGKTYEALLRSREDELKLLTDVNAEIKERVYKAQDEAKTEGLTNTRDKLLGKVTQVQDKERDKVRLTMSEGDKAIQEQIWKLEDAIAIRKLETETLTASGRTFEAMVRNRQDELKTLTEAQRIKKQEAYDAADRMTTYDLETRLLETQGKSYDALQRNRAKELLTVSNVKDALGVSDRMRLQEIHRIEDANKLSDITVSKLTAEGKTYEATLITRQKALDALSDEQRAEQEKVYAAEDNAKMYDMEIALLNTQGKSYQALQLQRAKELVALSDEQKVKQLQINAAEDAAKTQDLNIQLLEAQGRAGEALVLTRQKELAALSATDAAIQELIWQYEDLAVTTDLQVRLFKLTGQMDLATTIERQKEINALTSDTDKAILSQIHRAEDLNTARELDIELVEATGYSYNAMILSRRKELLSLRGFEQVYKRQIWAAQDAMKTYNLQIRLMRAMGNETGALAAERELELRTLSPTDQAIMKLIWHYEDQQQAADDAADSVEKMNDALRSSIEVLQDYKDSLMLSDSSILTTAQKYDQAKSNIDNLIETISKPATTDEEIAARDDAISEFTSTSDKFLELSRLLFSSSDAYSADYNWIISTVDSLQATLGDQLTDAQKQLAATNQSNTILTSISLTATGMSDALNNILTNGISVDTGTDTAEAVTGALDNSSTDILSETAQMVLLLQTIDYNINKLAYSTPIKLDKLIYGITGSLTDDLGTQISSSLESIREGERFQAVGSADLQLIEQIQDLEISNDPGKFADINALLDRLNNTVQAEQIRTRINDTASFSEISTAINTSNGLISAFGINIPGAISSSIGLAFGNMETNENVRHQETLVQMGNLVDAQRDTVLRQMLDEIKVLNEKITELEETVAQGAILNVEATNRNTDQISGTIVDSATSTTYSARLQQRAVLS